MILDSASVNILGPSLELHCCEVELNVSSKTLIVDSSRIIGCQVRARKALKGVPWCSAYLSRCKFTGRFTGCDFGRWPEFYDKNGGLVECDFSSAILDGCRFFSVDLTTLRLPPWPCITFQAPNSVSRRLKEARFSAGTERWRAVTQMVFESLPAEVTGVVDYFPTIAKTYEMSEAELREALAAVILGSPEGNR